MIMRLDKTEFLMYNRNRTFVRFTCRAEKTSRIVPKRKEEADFVALCCTFVAPLLQGNPSVYKGFQASATKATEISYKHFKIILRGL